jgi:hypothetical protein
LSNNRTKTVTFRCPIEIEVVVTAEVTAGLPGSRYNRYGDPGDPPEPTTADILEVVPAETDSAPDLLEYLTPAELEALFDAAVEAAQRQ